MKKNINSSIGNKRPIMDDHDKHCYMRQAVCTCGYESQIEKKAALYDAMTWQTIDTVPRDGTVVDLICYRGNRWTDLYFSSGKWKKYSNSYEEYEIEPKYWMNPPKPPK